jgi:thiol-disulfide isomerase/thioredoxin
MRLTPAVAVGILLASGCSDPTIPLRLAELETEVAELKKKVEEAPKAPAAKKPTKAQDPNAQAAAELFRAANLLINSGDRDGALAKLTELATKYGSTPAGKNGAQLKRELELVGTPAANYQVEKWYQGQVSDMSKPTLLVFWEVWCPHCKREVPKIEATHKAYGSKGLQVVGLTKQTRNITDTQVQDFISSKQVTYPMAKEANGAMSKAFAVSGIPAAAMVKDGKVVWRGHPGRLTNEMIEGWL